MIIRDGNPNRICLHNSATTGANNLQELKQHLASYEITHSKKSWAEEIKTGGEHGFYYVEYHVAFARDGSEYRIQDDKYVLYHATDNFRGNESFNLHGVGVLLDGNYEVEVPTEAMKEGVARYIARFEKQYKVNTLVRGHKQTASSTAPTACPGRNVGTNDSGWMKEVIARANEILQKGLTTEPLNSDEKKFPIPFLVSTNWEVHPSVDWCNMTGVTVGGDVVLEADLGGSPWKATASPDKVKCVMVDPNKVNDLKKIIEEQSIGVEALEVYKTGANERFKSIAKISQELLELSQ